MKTNGLKRVKLDSVFNLIFSLNFIPKGYAAISVPETFAFDTKKILNRPCCRSLHNPDISGIVFDPTDKKSSVMLTKNVSIRYGMNGS